MPYYQTAYKLFKTALYIINSNITHHFIYGTTNQSIYKQIQIFRNYFIQILFFILKITF